MAVLRLLCCSFPLPLPLSIFLPSFLLERCSSAPYIVISQSNGHPGPKEEAEREKRQDYPSSKVSRAAVRTDCMCACLCLCVVSPYDIVDSVTPCLLNGIWRDGKMLVLRMYVLIHRRTVGHGAGASTEYALPFQGLNISLSGHSNCVWCRKLLMATMRDLTLGAYVYLRFKQNATYSFIVYFQRLSYPCSNLFSPRSAADDCCAPVFCGGCFCADWM